jgi:hypothetical protein
MRAADAPISPADLEFFEAKVRPILVESCYKCHSVESGKSKGDLRLDSRDSLLRGGATGAVIVPGKPDDSLFIKAIRHTADDDLKMPPPDEGEEKLSDEKIAALEEWIRRGAPDPRIGGKANPMDMVVARQHWAFQPVEKPDTPAVRNTKWVKTPVDAFVLAQLEAEQLTPSPAADPRTLLRRVTYDLTGLPPTPQEMDAFLAETNTNADAAYAKAVERLLASPRYGERWGRFWLDVARYADTKGYLVGNAERRFAFSHTYRDYVIRAFNEDKPYDRFIVEQLAADQLPLGEDKSALAAMGFLTLGRRFLGNQNDVIDDRIDVVTRGLMGLTVTCARCHDHKFDPIPTKDYYSLHGMFASSEEPAVKPLLGPLVDSPAHQEFLKKTAAAEAKVAERAKLEVEKFLTENRAKTGDYLLGAHDMVKLKPDEKLDLFAGPRKLNVELLNRYKAWLPERAKANDPVLAPWFALAALPEEGFAEKARELIASIDAAANPLVVEALKAKPPASLKDAAEIYNQLFADADKVEKDKATPEQEALRQLLHGDKAPANPGYDAVAVIIKRTIDDKTAGLKRDVESLNWTEPGAPLRAMALVDKARPANSRVFLRGNPANRGPEVPRQFLEILSEADAPRTPVTKGSGRLDLAQAIADPKNPLTARVFVNRVWGWHFGSALVRTPSDFGVRTAAPVHLDLLDWLAATFLESGWSVKQLHRSIVLSSTYRQASDERPTVAAADPDNELLHRFNRRRLEWEAMRDTVLAVSGGLEARAGGLADDLTKEPFALRRTVYAFVDRQNLPGMFRTFDYPNPDVSSSQRLATTVPQQALYLMNSPFVQEQARRLAARPEMSAARDDAAKIALLYGWSLQRAPEAEELKLAKAFVARPAPAAKPQAMSAAGWQYGHGTFDETTNRVRAFTTMSTKKDSRLAPAEKFPDETFGSLHVNANGGHPGKTAEQASIRRWTAPAKGTVRIDATLGHANANGDGVRGRIVSSERGKLGEWTVHNTKAETKLDAIEVAGGETIDFVVDAQADGKSDAYTWSPIVAFTPPEDALELTAKTWNAKKDFETPPKVIPPMNRWEEFAQVLLLSNELAFVD